jgi:hemin uptake protein HemP
MSSNPENEGGSNEEFEHQILNADENLIPTIVDFKALTGGKGNEVWIRLEDGLIYRLQKTKHGKLLLSK